MARTKHTDNTNSSYKVSLRAQATSALDELRVLDLFAGDNILWSAFKCARYYGIEKEKGKGRNLHADNLKVIGSLDLSQFNVIDADSYGIPANQLEMVFSNKTLRDGTVIIYTCITNRISALSKAVTIEFGLQKINRIAPTLIRGHSAELFHSFLYEKGVRKICRYTIRDGTSYYKEYGYFVVTK